MKVDVLNNVNKLVISPLAQTLQTLTLSAPTVIDSKIINLVDATGVVNGSLIKIEENGTNPRTFHACVISINANELTLDRPLDVIFTTDATIRRMSEALNVNGSVTPVVFANANPFEQDVQLARIMFNMVTTDPVPFNGFGDLAALINGIELRKKHADGTYTNYFNAKTNNRLQLLMFDISFFDGTNPQAVNGLSGRLTFDKFGSIIELKTGEELQMIIQDDLSSLLSFEVITEGIIIM